MAYGFFSNIASCNTGVITEDSYEEYSIEQGDVDELEEKARHGGFNYIHWFKKEEEDDCGHYLYKYTGTTGV